MFVPLPGIVPPNPLPYILRWQCEYMPKSAWWKSLTWFCSHERFREQRFRYKHWPDGSVKNFNFTSPLTKIRLFSFAFFFRSLHTLTQCYVFVTSLFTCYLSSEEVESPPLTHFCPLSLVQLVHKTVSINKMHKHYHHLKPRCVSVKWFLFWLESTCLKWIYPDMEIKLLVLKRQGGTRAWRNYLDVDFSSIWGKARW